MPVVEGDATLEDTLIEAGLERARAIVGALNDDASNSDDDRHRARP